MPHQLHYQRYGEDGQPLLVLHGLFGSAKNWHSVALKLQPDYQVWALDLRNHGSSPWDVTMNYPALVEDLRDFIEHHHLGQVNILGHSMGGKVAMALALSMPQLINQLIVVDIAPVNYNHSFLDYVQAMQRVDLQGLNRRSEVDQHLSESIQDAGIRMFLLQNLVFNTDHYDWRINLSSLAANMQYLIGFPTVPDGTQFDGKTLFLRGEKSDYILPSHHPIIHQLFNKVQINTVANAGHWVHADQPAALIEQVRGFLG